MNGVRTALKHEGGKTFHNRLGLDTEVSKNGVACLAANELDGVAIDVGAERAMAPLAQRGRAGADVGRKKTEFGAVGGGSLSQCGGNVGQFYEVVAAVLIIRCNDGRHVCSML